MRQTAVHDFFSEFQNPALLPLQVRKVREFFPSRFFVPALGFLQFSQGSSVPTSF